MAVIERERERRRRGRRASCSSAGRRRSSWRCRCSKPASRSWARRRIRSTWPRIGGASRSCCGTSACRSRRAAPRCRAKKRARWPSASAIRSSSGRRTCSAAAGWRSCSTAGALDRYMTGAVDVSHDRPVLIDRFLEDAFEFDVDAVADATGAVVIGGIMEHIEEAGIHSGDSSCVVPPFMVAERHLATIREYTRRIARALEGRRADEHPVRDQGRHRLRARSESALVAHGAVHLEGDRRADGQDRRARRRRAARWRSWVWSTISRPPACSSRARCSRSCGSRASTRSSARR